MKKSCMFFTVAAVIGTFFLTAVCSKTQAQSLQADGASGSKALNSLSGSYSFKPSGLDGGGAQNIVAIDPSNVNHILSGADVAGVHISTDGGATWTISNFGLETHPALHVAAALFNTSQDIFIAVGNASIPANDSEGGIFRSTDGGATWKLFSTMDFEGGPLKYSTGAPPLPTNDGTLRSIGNLLAISDGYLYAGTFDDGVYRCPISATPPVTCTHLASGYYVRSLVLDAQTPTHTLYFAAIDTSDNTKNGVFQITNIESNHPVAAIGPRSSTLQIEELSFVKGDVETMYAVGEDTSNSHGVIYKVTSHGQTWPSSPTFSTSGDYYYSVDAVKIGTTTTVLVGTLDGAASGNSAVRFTDTGSGPGSLTSVNPNSTNYLSTSKTLVGGASYWQQTTTDSLTLKPNMGGPTFTMSHIQFSPNAATDNTVYAGGRVSVWKSTDLGQNWMPAARNINATFNSAVAVDSSLGRVYVCDTDWTFLYSTDGMADVHQNRLSHTMGIDVGVQTATTPHTVVIGVGDKGSNVDGEVFTSTDATDQTKNVAEGLGTAEGGNRVLGVASRVLGGTPPPYYMTILAAVGTSGVWRGTKTSATSPATWNKVFPGLASASGTGRVPLIWSQSGDDVYMYDLFDGASSGIYHSTTGGTLGSYSLVYSTTVGAENMALDESTNTLYFSNQNGLFYVLNANTAAAPWHPVQVTAPAGVKFGPMVVANGTLYVTAPATNVAPYGTANLYSYVAGGALTAVSLNPNKFYQENIGFPNSIAADTSGSSPVFYIGLDGQGVMIGTEQ